MNSSKIQYGLGTICVITAYVHTKIQKQKYTSRYIYVKDLSHKNVEENRPKNIIYVSSKVRKDY